MPPPLRQPLSPREHALADALAQTLYALDSALSDRRCEAGTGGFCDPAAGEPCWYCEAAATYRSTAALLTTITTP